MLICLYFKGKFHFFYYIIMNKLIRSSKIDSNESKGNWAMLKQFETVPLTKF